MRVGISLRRLRSMLRHLRPVPWSVYVNQTPRRRGGLFAVPGVEELQVVRVAHLTVVRNIYRNKGAAYIRLEFLKQLSGTGDIAALGAAFDRAFNFYLALCAGANEYETGNDPDIEEAFPCWEISAGGDSPLAALDGKRYRKSDPIWNEIFPPVDFGDSARISESEGRKCKPPAAIPQRVCNPIDFLRASRSPWWWPF